MEKNLIFWVHGMGTFEKDWSKEYQKSLDLSAKAMGVRSQRISNVIHVELNYDTLLEKYRSRISAESDGLNTNLKKLPIDHTLFGHLMKLLNTLGEDNFGAQSVLDVILYRYTILGEAIRVTLATTILEKIQAVVEQGDTVRFHFICHSLGTTVLHDTLKSLYGHSFKSLDGNKLDPKNWRPHTVMTLANVGWALKTDRFNPYSSVVRPVNTQGDNNGIVATRFVNAANQFDPFVSIKTFLPAKKWYPGEVNEYQYCLTRPKQVMDINMHALKHYIENPRVHIPFIESVFNRTITWSKRTELIDKYDITTPAGMAKSLKGKIESYLDNGIDYDDIVDAIINDNGPLYDIKEQANILTNEIKDIASGVEGLFGSEEDQTSEGDQ